MLATVLPGTDMVCQQMPMAKISIGKFFWSLLGKVMIFIK